MYNYHHGEGGVHRVSGTAINMGEGRVHGVSGTAISVEMSFSLWKLFLTIKIICVQMNKVYNITS